MPVNPAKCESILIRKYDSFITKRFKFYKNNENINVRIDGQNISAKNAVKYLGVIIDKKLSGIPHIDQTLRKAKGAYHVIKDVFMKKSISARVKIIAYKQLIRPIITYNFPGGARCRPDKWRDLGFVRRGSFINVYLPLRRISTIVVKISFDA